MDEYSHLFYIALIEFEKALEAVRSAKIWAIRAQGYAAECEAIAGAMDV